jgi:hypothetical protein
MGNICPAHKNSDGYHPKGGASNIPRDSRSGSNYPDRGVNYPPSSLGPSNDQMPARSGIHMTNINSNTNGIVSPPMINILTNGNPLQNQSQSALTLLQQQQQLNQQQLIEKPNYVALFDYESATKDDMTIKKDDQLLVIDKNHPDWWLAKNLRTRETGYVPFNYITPIDDLTTKP